MRQWLDLIAILILLAAVPFMSGCPSQSGSGVEPLAQSSPIATSASVVEPPLVELTPAEDVSAEEPAPATDVLAEPVTGVQSHDVAQPDDDLEKGPPPQTSLKIPQVEMTAEHEAQLFYRVGDFLPLTKLLNLAGEETSLSDYLGAKATIVLFWSVKDPYAFEAYRSLPADFSLNQNGAVGLLSINCGDAPKDIVSKVPGNWPPVLLAAPQSAEMPIRTDAKLPQIYVLDSQSRVVWCDIEYTRVTRDRITAALGYLAGN